MQIATELWPLDVAVGHLPVVSKHAKSILDRVRRVQPLPQSPKVLDVGAAQGLFLIACNQLGCDAVGVDPSAEARETSNRIAESCGVTVEISDGVAEQLPFEADTFDLVHANSVIEHVTDAGAAFREAYRVLKPGGVFWFFTASSVCPRQGEIRLFPAFGWYPNSIKVGIMTWAAEHRPDLVRHTTRPAIHWFTPKKARRMLAEAGFRKVYDRWDLRLPSEGGRAYQLALSLIQQNTLTKFVGDVFVPSCSYAAVK